MSESDEHGKTKPRIFIVEDEALIAMELSDNLQILGYDVCGHAARGESALREIPISKPDLVLMDVNLGRGPSGIEVANHLLASLDVPIIFLTAYSDADLASKISTAGSFAYLVKPFQPQTLRANINMALQRHAMERELRATNRKLAASEARFRRVTEHISDALIVNDREGELIFANHRLFRMFGIANARLQGLHIEAHVLPSWRREFRARRDHLLAEGAELQSGVFEGRRGDGSTLWIEENIVAVRDDSGVIIGTQSTLRDISAARRTDEALQTLSNELAPLSGQALYDAISSKLASLFSVEIGFVTTIMSSSLRRGRTAGLVIAGEVQPAVEFEQVDSPFESPAGESVMICEEGARQRHPEMGLLAQWGAESYVTVGLFDSKGDAIGSVGVMSRKRLRDADQVASILRLFAVRTAAEMERRREELRFENLLKYSPDAILMVDSHGRVSYANRRSETLLGYSLKELIGRSVDTLVPMSLRSSHADMRRDYLAAPRPRLMNARGDRMEVQCRDGSTLPVEISLGPYDTDLGTHVVVAVRDISERVQEQAERASLEAQLRQAQKLEALGRLAGGVAHDINNVLTAIIGNVALAQRDLPPEHSVLPRLGEISAASDRATDLVRQMLSFSRGQPMRRSVVELEPVVLEAVALLRATMPTDIDLKIKIGGNGLSVLSDATQLHQILMNLCTNALHAIESGVGTLEIQLDATEVTDDSAISIGVLPGRYARLSVADDGKGMDTATLESMFEPFFTMREVGKGTGLGLSIVHGIVRDHGGAIQVASTLGEGTVLTVYLPLVQSPSVSTQAPAVSSLRRGTGHVLYVDDDIRIVRTMTSLLSALGYQASCFVSGQEALEVFHADPERFDVVMTDLNMPGKSGLDVARAISVVRSDLPVILVTGFLSESKSELAANGIKHSLEKPFGIDQLGELLHRTLRPHS